MSEFFLGQIMMTGFSFAPKYFAQCNGQLIPISQNQALFSLLGTQYGGNGTTNFALPDLRSRTPVGYAPSVDPGWPPLGMSIGQTGGVENVTLLSNNLPAHSHTVNAQTSPGTTRIPRAASLAISPSAAIYTAADPAVPLSSNAIGNAGATQPHTNMQPYAALNFCIALSGIFPSRN